MKALLVLALFASAPAFAATTTYKCEPFRNSTESPKGYDLPESFELVIRGDEDAEFSVHAAGKTAQLKANEWSRATPNSKKFDRYAGAPKGAGLGGVLIQKNAAKLPMTFTAKLEFWADWFHDVKGWYGYLCH